MRFEKDNKVKYTGLFRRYWGAEGRIIKQCNYNCRCRIVEFTDGRRHHVYIKDLTPNIKNMQLSFDFMEE